MGFSFLGAKSLNENRNSLPIFGLLWQSSLSSFDPYTYLFVRCPSLYCVT